MYYILSHIISNNVVHFLVLPWIGSLTVHLVLPWIGSLTVHLASPWIGSLTPLQQCHGWDHTKIWLILTSVTNIDNNQADNSNIWTVFLFLWSDRSWLQYSFLPFVHHLNGYRVPTPVRNLGNSSEFDYGLSYPGISWEFVKFV